MTEFVSVPVPVDRVQEVYELLARPKAAVNNPHWTAPQSGDDESPYADTPEWPDELLDRLVEESSPVMRGILGVMADCSPKWVSTQDIATETELEPRQVVAALGPFFKRVRGRYAKENPPFDAREFPSDGLYRYSMPRENSLRVLARLHALSDDESGR